MGEVYGLVDEAWKEPAAIKFADERPLDDLMREAKEKAAQKNIGGNNMTGYDYRTKSEAKDEVSFYVFDNLRSQLDHEGGSVYRYGTAW